MAAVSISGERLAVLVENARKLEACLSGDSVDMYRAKDLASLIRRQLCALSPSQLALDDIDASADPSSSAATVAATAMPSNSKKETSPKYKPPKRAGHAAASLAVRRAMQTSVAPSSSPGLHKENSAEFQDIVKAKPPVPKPRGAPPKPYRDQSIERISCEDSGDEKEDEEADAYTAVHGDGRHSSTSSSSSPSMKGLNLSPRALTPQQEERQLRMRAPSQLEQVAHKLDLTVPQATLDKSLPPPRPPPKPRQISPAEDMGPNRTSGLKKGSYIGANNTRKTGVFVAVRPAKRKVVPDTHVRTSGKLSNAAILPSPVVGMCVPLSPLPSVPSPSSSSSDESDENITTLAPKPSTVMLSEPTDVVLRSMPRRMDITKRKSNSQANLLENTNFDPSLYKKKTLTQQKLTQQKLAAITRASMSLPSGEVAKLMDVERGVAPSMRGQRPSRRQPKLKSRPISKSGFVYKRKLKAVKGSKAPHMTGWKTRFFTLKGPKIVYSSRPEDKPKGEINMIATTVRRLNPNECDKPFSFEMRTLDSRYHIAVDSLAELEEWMRVINTVRETVFELGEEHLHTAGADLSEHDRKLLEKKNKSSNWYSTQRKKMLGSGSSRKDLSFERKPSCESGTKGSQIIDVPQEPAGEEGVDYLVASVNPRGRVAGDSSPSLATSSGVSRVRRDWAFPRPTFGDSSDPTTISSSGGDLMVAPYRQTFTPLPKLDRVFLEIYSTEKDYVNDLQIMIDSYMVPLDDSGLLTREMKQSLFVNVEEILPLHKGFLMMLEAQKTLDIDDRRVGQVFLDLASQVDIYGKYCSMQARSKTLIDKYCERYPKLAVRLEHLRKKPGCRNLDLNSFLIKPTQRLTKYPLLLREMLKEAEHVDHPDSETIKQALTELEDVVSKVNEAKVDGDRLHEMELIEDSIVDKPVTLTIIEDGRYVVAAQDFKKKYAFRALLPRDELVTASPLLDAPANEYAFRMLRIENKDRSWKMVVYCSSEKEREGWVEMCVVGNACSAIKEAMMGSNTPRRGDSVASDSPLSTQSSSSALLAPESF